MILARHSAKLQCCPVLNATTLYLTARKLGIKLELMPMLKNSTPKTEPMQRSATLYYLLLHVHFMEERTLFHSQCIGTAEIILLPGS